MKRENALEHRSILTKIVERLSQQAFLINQSTNCCERGMHRECPILRVIGNFRQVAEPPKQDSLIVGIPWRAIVAAMGIESIVH